jgi:tRNA threonylcarbamoyl adenosine modification protein YeaZ/ribosomal-protein-alanine acetyltransferase
MNTFLAIDTSTSRTSVAIIKERTVIFQAHHDGALSHGEILPQLVSKALRAENIIDEVIVGMGPGPFTGLRVGISFAQSFAFARGIKWVGICSLDSIALQISGNDFLVAVDARRKEVFYARYTDRKRVGEPSVCQPSQLIPLDIPIHGEESNEFPSPANFAEIAKEGQKYLAPIYIRRPDAFPAPIGVKFRAMGQLDLVPAFAIEKSVYGSEGWSMEQLKEEYHGKNRGYIAGESGGKLIAYAGVTNLGGIADVLTLTVADGHRRKGIGRELLRRLIDWARSQKCKAIMLEVRVGNEEAIPLYTSFGFIEISRRRDYYGPGKTAIVMRKDF